MERGRQLTLDQLMVDIKRSDPIAKQIEANSELIDSVINAVAEHYSLERDEMLGPSRRADLVEARFLAAHVLYNNSSLSFKAIAFALGRRDHTTMLNAIDKAGKLLAQPYFKERVDEVTLQIASLNN